jgi:hypothetical protein
MNQHDIPYETLLQRLNYCLDTWADIAKAAMRPCESGASSNPPDLLEWRAVFNSHGDPYVCEVKDGHERGTFGTVVTIGTGPSDYGRGRANFIGEWDPARVMDVVNFGRLLLSIHATGNRDDKTTPDMCLCCHQSVTIHGPEADGQPHETSCKTILGLAAMVGVDE